MIRRERQSKPSDPGESVMSLQLRASALTEEAGGDSRREDIAQVRTLYEGSGGSVIGSQRPRTVHRRPQNVALP